MASQLTGEQQRNFDNRLRELGMNPDQVAPLIQTGSDPERIACLSDDPENSVIPPAVFTVEHVDHLKQLAGIADEEYESGNIEHHHEQLPRWPQEKNEHRPEDLTPAENRLIRQALITHVYGHTSKAETYRTVLNNHFFPMTASVFAAQDVVVDPDHPLYLKANSGGYNFGTITVKPGGQIICEGDAVVTCQRMIIEDGGE